jgi:hypothetical protein
MFTGMIALGRLMFDTAAESTPSVYDTSVAFAIEALKV